MRIIGKQLVVALASAANPFMKPGADTVRQMPGFCVMKPAMERRVAGILLMPERDHAQSCSLQLAREVGNRECRADRRSYRCRSA